MAIYYVRPDGNNSWAGTGYLPSQAWATLSKAWSTMVAGDTCYIAPNTYRETPNNLTNGTSTNPISFIGDRKCQYFLDCTKGDVIISGLNAESDTTITRSVGIQGSVDYINISNIDIENISSNTLNCGNYCNITNCNMTKGIAGWGITGYSYTTLTNCKVFTPNITLTISGASWVVTNCILKCTTNVSVFYPSNTMIFTLNNCIIEGGYVPVSTNTTMNLNGCIWSAGNTTTAGTSIYLDVSTKSINAKGTTFIGRGSIIVTVGTSYFNGCKFKDFNYIMFQTVIPNVTDCEFDNAPVKFQSMTGGVVYFSYFKGNSTAVSGSGMSSCQANGCRFYGNTQAISGAGLTNTSATYGEVDVQAGVVTSSVSPISGTKSLKMMGYDYAHTYIMWIPCEANKPKTVKMKINRPNGITGSYIRFGDQVVQMSSYIKLQGLGWTIYNDASCSGGKSVYSVTKDDYIEYTFTGTGIRLLCLKNSSGGICGVSIDGGVETNVDTYNASGLYQQNVFEVTGLSSGTHKIKVRITGTKNASSTNYSANVDAFQIFNGSWSGKIESDTPVSNPFASDNIDITYTHHKTELVPLWLCPRVVVGGLGDWVQFDDIG